MPSSINDRNRHKVEPVLYRSASILLAAGAGTRLRPLTGSIPKPALPLLDIPLGAFGLTDLALLGGPVIVNLSASAEVVRAALSPFAPEAEFFLEEPAPFGSAGTVAAVAGRSEGRVVTRNADLLSDLRAADVVASHIDRGALATLATVAVDAGADFLVRDERVHQMINRKREPGAAGHMWLGVGVFERDAVPLIGPQRPLDLASGLIAPLIDRGEVAIHTHDGYALDVGTFDRYLHANLDLLRGIAPKPPGGVPGALVEVAGGRAYVGPGARVEAGTLGAGAVVMAGATISAGAWVEHGVVWPDEVVFEGTRVTDGIWALDRFWPTATSEN